LRDVPLQHQLLNADQDRATKIPLDANVEVELLMVEIRQQRQRRGRSATFVTFSGK
jgi:hypothetical protein